MHVLLTLFILMDFLRHVNRITMELCILYFKGSQVEISKILCISVMKIVFILQTVQTVIKCWQHFV